MDYINYFVMDVMEMFEQGMIRIDKGSQLVMIEERAMYLLTTTYRMDSEDILMLLQKTVKFMEKLDG